jgi:ABC-type protease/lipase transport system fused ATPase/permease subunit
MANKKKIIISIVVGIVLVAIVTTATILIINVINNNNAAKEVIPTETTAKDLRDQAEEARKNADTTKSKELLLEAQKQYETLPKTDVNTNAKADIELQLNLLKAQETTTPTQ